jgi:integrating conjugative element relaxase (TIGR03760 family)
LSLGGMIRNPKPCGDQSSWAAALFPWRHRRRDAIKQRPDADWLPVLPPERLLTTDTRRGRLHEINSIVSLSPAHYAALYQPAIEAFTYYVQQLPASEAHHHAGPGGLLDHGLEVAATALKLRRGHILPAEAPTELIKPQTELWSYATFTAALLHDIAKPAVDHEVDLFDAAGSSLGPWDPWAGPMPAPACWYGMRFRRGRRYRLHARAAPLQARWILPETGLKWLTSEHGVLTVWLAAITGNIEEAGRLGSFITEADALSVASDLSGGVTIRMPAAHAKPLHQRLITGLRYLLDNQDLPLNRPGAAGWLIGDELWLVVKTALDRLRAHLEQEGQTGIPADNRRLMDALQQCGVLVPRKDRAVWRGLVTLGAWRQELTLLRFPAAKIWSDLAARPAVAPGTVEPVTEKESETDAAPDGLTDAPPTQTADESTVTVSEAPIPTRFATIEALAQGASVSAEPASPEAKPEVGADSSLPVTTAKPVSQGQADADLGHRFLEWLRNGLATGTLPVNTTRARVHGVKEGLLLVSPAIFKDFATAENVPWTHVQKRFQKLKLHQKTSDGFNIWIYQVKGERRTNRIKGLLIQEPPQTLGLIEKWPPPNSHLSRLTETD